MILHAGALRRSELTAEGTLGLKRATHLYCEWLMLLLLTGVAGCGGCRSDEVERLTREEREKLARDP